MNKRHSLEEKENAIKRYVKDRESPLTIIKDIGISKSTFYKWLSEDQDKQKQSDHKILTLRNFKLLEAKIARLEGVIEIIKKANVLPNSPLKDKLYAAESISDDYSVHMLCEALDIPRGTYYNHILRNKRDNTWYAKRRETLREQIQEIYDESNQIFGAAKITAVLHRRDIKTSVNMDRQLMSDMGLVSIRQDAKKYYDENVRQYKNYLNQEFNTTAPDQVWVSDVTYFKCNNKQYYICAVIDLYARKIISYKIGKINSTQLVKTTFKAAYEERKPSTSLIFHTDRGSNYISKELNDYLKSLQITHSFSRAYVPYDNSVMESFFASLKREELYRKKYRSEKEFYKAVDDYIEFYNEQRPHAKLQYKTPNQKEREYKEKSEDFKQINRISGVRK